MNIFTLGLFLAAAPAAKQDAGETTEKAPPAALVPVPTQTEARRVLDYYHLGKAQGPLLIELQLCDKVDTAKDSPTRNECLEQVQGSMKTGAHLHVGTLWLVPEGGDYEDVAIQFAYQGQVRNTQDLRLNNPGRTRAWRAAALSKAGTWEVKVIRGTQELAAQTVVVKD